MHRRGGSNHLDGMQATALAALLLMSSAAASVVELKVIPGARLLAAVEVVEFPDTAAQPTAAQSQLLSVGNNGTALVQQTVSTHARPAPRHCRNTHNVSA